MSDTWEARKRRRKKSSSPGRNRTGDLLLTGLVLYLPSYRRDAHLSCPGSRSPRHSSPASHVCSLFWHIFQPNAYFESFYDSIVRGCKFIYRIYRPIRTIDLIFCRLLSVYSSLIDITFLKIVKRKLELLRWATHEKPGKESEKNQALQAGIEPATSC